MAAGGEQAGSPQLVIIAGPNGSGKSTLIAALRASPDVSLPALYVNADDLQRERGIADPEQAQRLATDLRRQALQARRDVMYETVMSHPSKLAELQQAKASGYHIVLHLVATDDPAVNAERVAARVAAGGHDVPTDRIRARYERTLALAPVAVGLADQAFVHDNTLRGLAARIPALQAALMDDRLEPVVEAPAPWVTSLIVRVGERAAEQGAFVGAAQARGLALRPAPLDAGSTQGAIVAIGKRQVLQYDEATRGGVLHERVLLGARIEAIEAGRGARITYRDGVASIEPPRLERTR